MPLGNGTLFQDTQLIAVGQTDALWFVERHISAQYLEEFTNSQHVQGYTGQFQGL